MSSVTLPSVTEILHDAARKRQPGAIRGEITAKDIASGEKHCSTHSPLARAICRALGLVPDEKRVKVGYHRVEINSEPGCWFWMFIPLDLRDQVMAFDSKNPDFIQRKEINMFSSPTNCPHCKKPGAYEPNANVYPYLY